eukprot:CAMPEP_0117695946 /NCGR_PEP_ID=MMETSP0804-20121206/28414_1 /TAXON_ID=1074897 /ORGANISM="Tetraselmis astigmatica, Strain CCMP880" /LENGTH=507 /DNA_ID=CAMNT_0005510059 /DNA_START=116 /DNA_END=1638 /DNA_ORIENTATION=-
MRAALCGSATDPVSRPASSPCKRTFSHSSYIWNRAITGGWWGTRTARKEFSIQKGFGRTSCLRLLSKADSEPCELPETEEGAAPVHLQNVTIEIAAIALPILAALAADPLAGIVDSAFLGHLGATQLAGAGVSLSFFETVTKLINVPLLAVTTSTIAAALGKSGSARSPAVAGAATSMLLVAGAVGLAEVLVLLASSHPGLVMWGLEDKTAVFIDAENYLSIRALGGSGNNLASCFSGVNGAAYATVAAEGIASVYLISELAATCGLSVAERTSTDKLAELVKPTGYLMLRTLALAGTFAFATSVSARLGVDLAATHQICFQVWLASSLLSDALAVAAQSLLARTYASGDYNGSRRIVSRSLQLGTGLGLGLGALLYLGQEPLLALFSSEPDVVKNAHDVFLAVVLTQPFNALAFVWDGILYGVGGFGFAALVMPLCVSPSLLLLWAALANDSMTGNDRLSLIWVAMGTLMLARAVGVWIPYKTQRGPFKAMQELGGSRRDEPTKLK